MTPSTTPAHHQRKGLILALLAMTQFIIVLDASIVNVALPSIQRDLDFTQESITWVLNAYALTFGGFLLLGGRLADLLGGILTQSLGWEAVLLVNVPVVAGIVFAAPRVLPESRSEGEGPRSLDIPGAVTITGGIGVLIYALVNANSAGWGSGQTIALLAGAAALVGLFIAIESRHHAPLVPLGIFRLGTLRGANVVGLLIGASLFSMFLFITFYLQNILGHDALRTGFEYLPLCIVIILSAGAASAMVSKIGFKMPLVLGMLLITFGLLWFSRISVDGSWAGDILGPSILAAAGLGFSFVPVTIAAVSGTKPEEAGLASGLINTVQQVGGALGVSVLIAVASGSLPGGGRPSPEQLTEGYSNAFLVGAGFALVGALYAAFAISSKDSKAFVEAAAKGEAPAVAVG